MEEEKKEMVELNSDVPEELEEEEIKVTIPDGILLDDLLTILVTNRKEFSKVTGVNIDKVYGKKAVCTMEDVENVYKYLFNTFGVSINVPRLLNL